jgi:hypothetical protein
MNDEPELDPVQRLRAADPAAGLEPGDGFVDRVLARTADASDERGEGAASALPESSDAPVADLAAERVRRRSRWIPLVAVAASLVVFGGAGYALGATSGGPTGGSTEAADGAAPPISLQGVAGGAAPEMAQGDAAAGAATEAKMSEQVAADMMYPYGSGRNSFQASGLSTQTGAGPAYAYDPGAASNAETVSALATALGVEGTPELKDGAWLVGPQGGTGASLYVGLDGTLSFSFFDPALDPWACEVETLEGGEEGDGGADGMVAPCEPTGTPPSEEAAIAALRSIVVASGRDADAFEYTTQTWDGAVTRTASAWPIVDGQRLDQSWSAEVTEEGVLSASGALAGLVTLGDYDLVSEQEAFERLSDPRFGAQMTALPIAMREQLERTDMEWVPPTEPPATPASGAAVAWPVNDVEITSARLGLASQWQPDGGVLQVPAYEFTDAGGGTWSVIAVADSELDFASE